MGSCHYLRVSIIDRCNLRCRYCMPPEGVSLLPRCELLTFDEIQEVVRAGVSWGIRKVRITGGEPLIRRNMLDLMTRLSRVEGLRQLALTTNGTRLTSFAPSLRCLGVSPVNVSLDTLYARRFSAITGDDQLERVLDGISAAVEVGIDSVKINVVVMRGVNDDELLDFVLFALERPVTVRFIEVMPFVSPNPTLNDMLVTVAEIRRRIEESYRLTALPRKLLAGPANEFSVNGGSGRIGFIATVSEPPCHQCDRLRLTSQGDLRPCLADEAGIPLRPILRRPHSQADLLDAFDRAALMKSTCRMGCYSKLAMSQIGG